MYRLKDLDKKESELRSKLFYYLNNFNLDFVSLGNEEVRYFDPGAQQANGDSCEKLSTIPFDNLEDESTCFQATDAYTNEEAISELTSDEDTVSDVRQMIQTLKITPELADKICYHQLNRFYQVKFNAKKENRKKHKPGKVPMYTSNKVPEVIYTRDMGKIPSEEIKFHEECVAELVAQVNFDPIKKFDIINGSILDVERKIRVKDTGRYAFKGGKALNVNVGNQLSLNHNTSYGFSESRAFKFNNISDTLLGWIPAFGKGIGRWAKNLFDTAGDMIMGDQKWAESDTNSVGEGTAISEGTFLVMQNATLDVELEDYYQCVAITFSETFLNRIDIKGESYKEQGLVEPFIQTLADVNGIEGTDEELIGASNSFKSAATRGLLICDDSEQNRNKENYRTLPIRENFYYFTQHFTEGDMLDSGDLANHPWLKNIRGKTDMWRFLSKIRNQDMSIKGKNKTLPYAKYLEQMGLDRKYIEGKDRKVGFRKQRGSLNLGDEWPIYQLIKAYHGTVPTFPGVYSSLHSPCNYGLDFPWGDQAKDSFEAKDTAMFDNFENRAKSKIQRSIKKFHEANFITDDPDVQASIEAGVYDSDEDIENHTMRTVRENNPDAAALYPDLFEPASKSEPKEGDREQKHIFPYEKNGNGTLKGINMVIMKKERDQNSDNPSQERIDACLGYMN